MKIDEFLLSEFSIANDIAMEQALNYRLHKDGIKVTVNNDVATFENNTKYSEGELKAIIEEVKQGKFE